MKAVLVKKGGGLEIAELEIPRPGEGEILVRMVACGICGTDLEKVRGGTETPPVLGHEVVGIVEDVGRGVGGLRGGERVFVHHHVSCGACWYCYNDSETMCPLFRETNIWPGGFSEYFLVPRANVARGSVHVLPESISWARGTFIEPLATVVRALRRSTFRPGHSAWVVGSGPMGLLFTMLLRASGASEIRAVDLSRTRCSAALRAGADLCLSPADMEAQPARGDIVVVSTGSPRALLTAFKLVRRGGEILFFGAPPPGSSQELPISRIFYDEVRITPSYSASERDVEASIRILSRGLPVEDIVSHVFDLGSAERAFEIASDPEKALKVLVASGKEDLGLLPNLAGL